MRKHPFHTHTLTHTLGPRTSPTPQGALAGNSIGVVASGVALSQARASSPRRAAEIGHRFLDDGRIATRAQTAPEVMVVIGDSRCWAGPSCSRRAHLIRLSRSAGALTSTLVPARIRVSALRSHIQSLLGRTQLAEQRSWATVATPGRSRQADGPSGRRIGVRGPSVCV